MNKANKLLAISSIGKSLIESRIYFGSSTNITLKKQPNWSQVWIFGTNLDRTSYLRYSAILCIHWDYWHLSALIRIYFCPTSLSWPWSPFSSLKIWIRIEDKFTKIATNTHLNSHTNHKHKYVYAKYMSVKIFHWNINADIFLVLPTNEVSGSSHQWLLSSELSVT